MELNIPKHRRNRVTWINKRTCRCCASHFQACCDAINNFGKLEIKENLAEKLKQIGQVEVTPDCEEVLRTKGKWCEKINDSFNNYFCSVFNLKLLSFPALVKAKSNASLQNEAIFQCPVCSKSMRREVQIARFWLTSCRASQS